MILGSLLLMNILWSLVHCKERAVLEVVMHKITKNGEYKTEVEKIIGHFSAAGPTVSAEGDILQIHPMSICSRDMPEQMVYGWVGVMKLEKHIGTRCMNLYEQAKVAIRRGATAVIFDVSDVPDAAKKLRHYAWKQLDRPVIIIRGMEAIRLMTIIQTQQDAWARIRSQKSQLVDPPSNENDKEYLDVGIFVAVFVVLCIVVIVIIIKFRCRQREPQLSLSELAKQAIAKLETRKYHCKNEKSVTRVTTPTSDVYSQSSSIESCAICLEEYREGQVLRVLPCSHEFHSICVDPWLLHHRTCPFCMYNIIEQHETQQSCRSQQTEVRTTNQRQFYQLPPQNDYRQISHSQYLHYLNYHSELQNGCTSCEGTVGSSVSSCNSCYHQNAHHSFYGDPMHRSYYQALQRSCCNNNVNRTTEISRVFPCNSSFVNSGISYSHHVTASSVHHHTNYCSTHRQIHNSTHHYYLGQSTRLFRYKMKNDLGRTFDSEPEYNSGKEVSIKAQYGSCSSESCSDGNPSSSSLECPDCVQPCDNNVADSNGSTYGSSENHDCSDNASYDSNVFWGGAPDQMCTDLSSSLSEMSGQVNICHCIICGNENIDENSGKINSQSCDRKNSVSTLNLSEISGCDTVRSVGNDSTCNSCQSIDPLLNLSKISGLTADEYSDISSTSHIPDDVHICSACNHGNNQTEMLNYSPFKNNTLPRTQMHGRELCNSVNTLPRIDKYNSLKCVKCKGRSVGDQTTNLQMSRCVHKQEAQERLLQSTRLKENCFRPTNHDTGNQTCNHNTQGYNGNLLLCNNKLHIAEKTVTRERSSLRNLTNNLLPNFRLSRSCDILPVVRNSESHHGDLVVNKQPRLLTKDSVVKATSQGSTVTVFLRDKEKYRNGNIV